MHSQSVRCRQIYTGKRVRKREAKYKGSVGKKKKKASCCKEKKEKLENRDSCHLLSIKKRRELYIYQSIGRHSITGEASFFYDRHGNGQTIHRHAQRSHCSFGGRGNRKKIKFRYTNIVTYKRAMAAIVLVIEIMLFVAATSLFASGRQQIVLFLQYCCYWQRKTKRQQRTLNDPATTTEM